jgi:hypothetical protein
VDVGDLSGSIQHVRGFLPGTAGALSSTCRVDRILLVGVCVWVGEWGGGWQMDSGFGMEDCGLFMRVMW